MVVDAVVEEEEGADEGADGTEEEEGDGSDEEEGGEAGEAEEEGED